ncbi:MAG: GWxTD domain-containing protein [Bacillota bacterium]
MKLLLKHILLNHILLKFILLKHTLLLVSGILSASLFAQDTMTTFQKDVPVSSTGNILFFADHSGFRGKDNKTFEEFYIMIPADQLNYKTSDNKNTGSVKIRSTLSDSAGRAVLSKEWVTETSLPSGNNNQIKGLAIYDQWNAGEIIPGRYIAEIEVSDQNSTNHGKAVIQTIIPDLSKSIFSASQIEFVTRMDDSSGSKQFMKGKISMVPNPSRRFGILNPVLYLYYELYNIETSSGENLSATYSITSSDGKIIKRFPSIQIRSSGKSAGVFHGVNVATVPSGIYQLNAEVVDSGSGKSLSLSRGFEVLQYRPAKQQTQLTEEQAEIAGRIISNIAPDRYKLYEKLDLAGKAQFLIRFWNEFDPSPGTPENEYLQKIINRYQFANQNFSWGKTEGWKTDRGMILIKYGNPDEIERHEFETDSAPYEIWYYRQDKSYMFVFADLKSNGRYSLIHSTKEGEVNNPYWQEQVKRM